MVANPGFIRPGAQVESRRTQIERLRKVQGGIFDLTVYVPMDNNTDRGEVLVDVRFPLTFTERPIPSFGAELEHNQSPVAGFFPTVSAVVTRWEKPEFVEQYTGAKVAVMVTGHAGMLILVALQFRGKGIQNPTTTADSTDSAL